MCCAAIKGPESFYLLRLLLGAAEAGARAPPAWKRASPPRHAVRAGASPQGFHPQVLGDHGRPFSRPHLTLGCFPGMWWTCEQVGEVVSLAVPFSYHGGRGRTRSLRLRHTVSRARAPAHNRSARPGGRALLLQGPTLLSRPLRLAVLPPTAHHFRVQRHRGVHRHRPDLGGAHRSRAAGHGRAPWLCWMADALPGEGGAEVPPCMCGSKARAALTRLRGLHAAAGASSAPPPTSLIEPWAHRSRAR
jgi:hypothetical protein